MDPLDLGLTKEATIQIAHRMSVEALAKKMAVPRKIAGNKRATVSDWCEDWHAYRVKMKVVEDARHDR